MNIQSSGLNLLRATVKAGDKLDQLHTATQGFEAIFLKRMLSAMHSESSEALFGKSAGSDTYKDMFNDAIANAAAKRSQLGIGKVLFDSASTRVISEALQAEPRLLSVKDSKQQ